MLGGLSGALVDMDGSETGVFRITGVPAGSTFGGKGRNLGGGVWEFAPAEMAAPLTFAPPQNLHGVFNLVLEGVTTESANGDRATVSRAFTSRSRPSPTRPRPRTSPRPATRTRGWPRGRPSR